MPFSHTTRTIGPSPCHRSRPEPFVVLSALCCVTALHRYVRLDAENNARLVWIRFSRQQDSLAVLLAHPSCLEQRNLRPAVLALDCSCPEVSHGGLGHPARIALVGHVLLAELGIQCVDIRRAVVLQGHKPHGLLLVGFSGLERLEVRIGRIELRQILTCTIQYPLTPGAHVPGQICRRSR